MAAGVSDPYNLQRFLDAHDLGVAAIDHETLVHKNFLPSTDIQAMGSDVAAETRSSADRKAPATIVAVSRTDAMVNMIKPLLSSAGPDHRVRAPYRARPVPNEKNH